MITIKQIQQLKEGDLVDLEGDEYATSDDIQTIADSTYFEVLEIVKETEECFVVYFDGPTIGFPPNHEVKVFIHE